jgi:arginase
METDRSRNWLGRAGIQPILVPMALGCMCRGVDQSPEILSSALRSRWEGRRDANLLQRLGEPEEVPVAQLAETDQERHPGQALHAHEIAQACSHLAERTQAALMNGDLPVVLGGDHAVAIGSVAGAAEVCERLAVIWIDAHGDLNWPKVSPSGRIHGMPLGVGLGRGLPELTGIGANPELHPEDVHLIGVRSLDFAERAWIREGQIDCATMAEIDDVGLDAIVERTVDRIHASDADAVHLSFDVDALDPSVMPGTGSRSIGGLTFREAAYLLRRLRASDLPIHSLDWVELNPTLDPTGGSTQVAVKLLAIALGEEIV